MDFPAPQHAFFTNRSASFHEPEAPAREMQEGTQTLNFPRWRFGFVFQHENKRNFKKRTSARVNGGNVGSSVCLLGHL